MLKDRQLLVSPEPPSTLGVVTSATDNTFRCEVLFRGKLYSCYSAGKNALAVNDLVSFWEIDGFFFCAKSDAGYPTRFKRPMIEWAATHPHNLLLQYCVRKQANIFTYRLGVVEAVASEFSLIVGCWDGMSRECRVEYAGELRSASAFAVGEAVVLYQKPTKEWIVIGRLATIIADPTNIDFGDTPVIVGGDPVLVEVTQTGSTEEITVTAPTHFAVATSETGTYGDTVVLPGAGGDLWIKYVPLSAGAISGEVQIASSAASTHVGVAGVGVRSIVISAVTTSAFPVAVADSFPQYGTRLQFRAQSYGATEPITVSCAGVAFSSGLTGALSETIEIPASGGYFYAALNPTYDGYFSTEKKSSAEALLPVESDFTGDIIGISGDLTSNSVTVTGKTQRITTRAYAPPGIVDYYVISGYGTFSITATADNEDSANIVVTCRASVRATISITGVTPVTDDISGADPSVGPVGFGYTHTTLTGQHNFTVAPIP